MPVPDLHRRLSLEADERSGPDLLGAEDRIVFQSHSFAGLEILELIGVRVGWTARQAARDLAQSLEGAPVSGFCTVAQWLRY